MRFSQFIVPLVLFPFCAFSQADVSDQKMFFSYNPVEKNTIVKTYSNEIESFNQLNTTTRSFDYPTQIIRTSGSIEGQKLSCEEVNEIIHNKLVAPITSDKFFYMTYVSCSYDPKTELATHFMINSFFDPLNEKALEFLNAYLAENDGSDLFGTKVNIESAKSLIIALSISAGMKKNPSRPPMIEYKQDRSNFHFNSNYDMKNKFFTDVYQNFFSNDPNKILPFLDKWVFWYAGMIYQSVLKDSDYVELQPERIFVMDSGEPIFVSNLKYYFGHICKKYDNHHCL